MRLQIKTLSQKSLMIDIEPNKTVYDLKRELSLYPDVGVKPELQKLIYAGKILNNEDTLSAYNIDAKKFLVVMVLKQPIEETRPAGESAAGSSSVPAATQEAKKTVPAPAAAAVTVAAATAPAVAEESAFRRPASPVTPTAARSENEEMVQNIVSMGYPEAEVRRALAASFNSPERAIEYLIEGIPDSVAAAAAEESSYMDTDADASLSPFEIFRSDPLFRNLSRAIQQHPEMIDEAIQRVGEANPAILNLINENQQEFLAALLEAADDDDEEDDETGGGDV